MQTLYALDKNLRLLFSFYPREYSKKRILIHSPYELERRMNIDNGLDDIFVSVYDVNHIIDKIVFDIDGKSLPEALKQTNELINRLEEAKIPTIPIFSGKKGFHVYALFEPWRSTNDSTASEVVRLVSVKFAEGLSMVDSHLIGNISALIRVPNTIHPNGYGYCTYLRPSELADLSTILELCKHRRSPEYFLYPRKDIRDFVDLSEIKQESKKDIFFKPNSSEKINYRFLSNLLRPCIAKAIFKDPCHMVRVEFVAELRELGYTADQILKLCSQLDWADFNPEISSKQIAQVFKGYKPLRCQKLKKFVNCTNCGWVYWW